MKLGRYKTKDSVEIGDNKFQFEVLNFANPTYYIGK